MELIYHGAAEMVTGSSLEVVVENRKILIDCGMFQGLGEVELNNEEFNFEASKIDCVFLTHSHLDHCGRLPKLYKQGFRGKIYLSAQTSEITKVILRDAAKIQEINKRLYSEIEMYTIDDVEETIKLFETVDVLIDYKLSDAISFRLLPVGHILGAVSVSLTYNNSVYVFSGDIGRMDQAIIKTFSDYDFSGLAPSYLSMESLYGGIEHESRDANILQIVELVNATIARGGKIIIPLFVLQRTQEILEMFKLLFRFKLIPEDLTVYLDSPMAIAVTDIYEQNTNEFNTKVVFNGKEYLYEKDSLDGFTNQNRFKFMQLKELKKSKASKKIANRDRSIILAGSGMAEGGRVVRHLANYISDPKNTVIFVGFQAEGTLGRKLVEGEKSVEINGEFFDVKAQVSYLRGFSAHGDDTDLKSWIKKFDLVKLKKIFLCHAEPERLAIFCQELKELGYNAEVVERSKSYQID